MDSLKCVVILLVAALAVAPGLGLEGAHRSLRQSRVSAVSSFKLSVDGTKTVTGGSASSAAGSSRSATETTLFQTKSSDGLTVSGSTSASATGKTNGKTNGGGGGGGGGCPAGCTDDAPSSKFTCADQKRFGKCDQNWMKAGKFCQCTCGRCDSPPPKTQGCKCGDKPPSRFWTCEQQKKFGKCSAGWMKEQGFCKCTCGHC